MRGNRTKDMVGGFSGAITLVKSAEGLKEVSREDGVEFLQLCETQWRNKSGAECPRVARI